MHHQPPTYRWSSYSSDHSQNTILSLSLPVRDTTYFICEECFTNLCTRWDDATQIPKTLHYRKKPIYVERYNNEMIEIFNIFLCSPQDTDIMVKATYIIIHWDFLCREILFNIVTAELFYTYLYPHQYTNLMVVESDMYFTSVKPTALCTVICWALALSLTLLTPMNVSYHWWQFQKE